MAPAKKKTTRNSKAETEAASNDGHATNPSSQSNVSQSQSQDLDAGSIQRLLEQSKSSHAKWRKSREKALLASRTQRLAKLKKRVDSVYETHGKRLRAFRRSKLERFVFLVQRQSEIASEMARTRAELKAQVVNVMVQFGAVLEGRAKAMR